MASLFEHALGEIDATKISAPDVGADQHRRLIAPASGGIRDANRADTGVGEAGAAEDGPGEQSAGQIGAGEIGIVKSRSGKPLPAAEFLVYPKNDIYEFKGVWRNVLTPGTWRLNPLAFEVEKGKATRVPYKSMGDSVADLDGSLDFVIADGTFAVGQARSGRMKLLAVTTLERSGVTPDLPTMDELGYKGYDIPASFGAYAPKATPKEIVAKLEGWLNEIVRRPETKTFLYNLATDPYPGDQALLRKIMVEETKKWGEMMESAGVEKQ